jgi:hypothetical protein
MRLADPSRAPRGLRPLRAVRVAARLSNLTAVAGVVALGGCQSADLDAVPGAIDASISDADAAAIDAFDGFATFDANDANDANDAARVRSDGASDVDAAAPTHGCYSEDLGLYYDCAAGEVCNVPAAVAVIECNDPDAATPLDDAGDASGTFEPCGDIFCGRDCVCAKGDASLCQCTFLSGPLAPPDLPAAMSTSVLGY